MKPLAAARSMVMALADMIWAIDAARYEISSCSSCFSRVLDELAHVFIRCREEIEDAAVFLEAAAAAVAARRDTTESRRLRVQFHCLKLMAKAWRRHLGEQRWWRCTERCYHRSTAKRFLLLKRFATIACRGAEKRVARLPELPVSAAEEAPPVVDDEEGTTTLADFRAMAEALLAIEGGRDAMEDSEEYQEILRGMERLFSSA